MADIKISELGAASAVNNADLIPMTSAGVTVKATAQQFKNYMGVGNLADLTTDAKASAVAAINEVNTKASKIGNLADLDTTDKSSAVAAINEVNTKVSKTEVLISIVENGNTCTHTGGISKGQYVNWKGSLYTADSNISVGATFASSGGSKNLTAVVDGGLNDLIKQKTAYSNNLLFVKCGHVVTFSGFLYFDNQVASNSNTNYVTPYKAITDTNICLVKTGGNSNYTAVPMIVATSGRLRTGDAPCPAGYYLASGCYFTND